MSRLSILLLFVAAGVAVLARPHSSSAAPEHRVIAERPGAHIVGRWDLTVHERNWEAPSWLEVDTSGRDALVGRFVGEFGSARPISSVDISGDSIHFAIPH